MQHEFRPRNYQEERLQKLFDECRNTVIGQIIGPFGLSMAMFDDKDGGNVDTIHNAREGVYASEREKQRFENREDYDARLYHSHKNYKAKNKVTSEAKKAGTLKDSYSGETISPDAKKQGSTQLDHTVAAKEVHDDPGRILAEADGVELANSDSNLNPTTAAINQSKKEKSITKYSKWLQQNKEKRQNRISELSQKEQLTDKEKSEFRKLKEQEKYDADLAKKVDKEARKALNNEINKKYYTSKKFIKSAAKDAGKTALKTAIQQALGSLLVEFTQATFYEMKMFIRERAKTGKNIFEDIKSRLKRIIKRVLDKLSRWKEIAAELRDGLLSGFISSLTTTLINIFATTAKRFVRAIREGIRSIIQAFKVLFFRPSEMTEEEAIKIVIKSLSGVFITTISIAAESGLNAFLNTVPIIGQFASIITPVLLSILSGISIAIISYYVDKVFRLFALSEERLNQICKVEDLQLQYSSLLIQTSENIINMGIAYQQIINGNIELAKSNRRIFTSQLTSISTQKNSLNAIDSTISSYDSFTKSISEIKSEELKNELKETSAWIANRRKRKK